jgi:hypothetical protein
MIIVQETNVNQTFDFIPREGLPVVFELIDENTNVMVLINGSFTPGDYVYQFTGVLPTEENHFYWMILKDLNNNIVLKERLFCTNQPISTFSVNAGEYISNQTTNDFIMYE